MLTKTLGILSVALCLSLTSMTVTANTKEQAEELPKNCQYLKEVTTNETHISKKIDSMIGGRNFDTDFAVPAGTKFTSFRAMMTPENEGTYGVTINLKYTDNSVSTAFRKNAPMENGKTYSLPFQSPTGNQPYQINLNINGNNDNTYTIAVMACQ